MAFFSQNHFVLALFLIILTIWTSHVLCSRLLTEADLLKHEQWMVQYGKSYMNVEEKQKRFQIFMDNVDFIESFNAAGDKPFKLSINHFADQTNEEFRTSLLNGLKRKQGPRSSTTTSTKTSSFRYENVTVVPDAVDWRKKGAVTPIKSQGTCASCWAFSTVAAIESIHQITTRELVSLSEQELVDCVKGESQGCKGGYTEDAFKFLVKKGGIASEAHYSYKGADGTCKIKKKTHHNAAQIKGYEKVPVNSEDALLKAVANQPVSVDIDADGLAFRFYSGGIYTGNCTTITNHCVTVVGYDKAHDGTKYWLVKNSWSTEWGEKGYIRMKRDIHAKEGLCGIATGAIYPHT